MEVRQKMVLCNSCGTEGQEGDNFCRQCGEELAEDTFNCECGADVLPNDNFCHNCGAAFTGVEESDDDEGGDDDDEGGDGDDGDGDQPSPEQPGMQQINPF